MDGTLLSSGCSRAISIATTASFRPPTSHGQFDEVKPQNVDLQLIAPPNLPAAEVMLAGEPRIYQGYGEGAGSSDRDGGRA